MNEKKKEVKITSKIEKSKNLLNKKILTNSNIKSNKLNKGKKEEKNIPIEKFEFILEDNNKNQKKIQYLNNYYKAKLKKSMKIKNENESQIINNKKMYNIKKKYLKGKQIQENKEVISHKMSPYSFKYFNKIDNKKISHKSLSSNNKDINNMESNFMKLCKEANIYTSNANYIKNKKMVLFDKFNYDNNIYIPDRAKLFRVTKIPNVPNKNSFIYKTTKFRAGHFISNNHSKNRSENLGGNSLLNNTSLFDTTKKNQYENCLQFRNFSNSLITSSYIDNSFQNSKRYPPSGTLYKELMGKKNETLELFLKSNFSKKKKSKDNETEKCEEKKDDNKVKDDSFFYSFYKDYNNKIKIKDISILKKLYYKQFVNNNSDLNGYSSLLSKKKSNWGFPLSCPKIFSANIIFDNKSQKERYEKISESFYNLKELMNDFINEGRLNELDYIYEYCVSKNIDKKYLTITNLNNFYDFLHEKKLLLDLSKTLKENIILALEFDKNKFKNKKKGEKKRASNIYTKKINLKRNEKRRNKNKNKEEIDLKPRMIDFERQNKVNNQEYFCMSDGIIIRNELKKELDSIKNEVINKQKIMQNFQKKEKNESNVSITSENNKKNKKIEEKVFDSNERLYYTWYKNNSYNINNFVKKAKLTELYFYNRAKERIKQNVVENEYFHSYRQKSQQ